LIGARDLSALKLFCCQRVNRLKIAAATLKMLLLKPLP
jgi:hypothetical protein